MCVDTEAAAWKVPLPIGDKLVLVKLAFHRNHETGICNPGVPLMAKDCWMDERSIRRIIARLVAAGLVSKTCAPGKAAAYEFHLTPDSPVTPDRGVTLTRGSVTPDRRVRPPLTGESATPDYTVRRTGKNQQKNRKEQGKRASAPLHREAVDDPPPSSLNLGAWHRWEQYRSQIRKPIKQPSIAAAQRQLAGFGADQPAVVEQSIANGWQGLFPLKDAGPQRQGSGAPPKQTAMSRLLGNLGKPVAPRDAGDDDAIPGDFFPVPA